MNSAEKQKVGAVPAKPKKKSKKDAEINYVEEYNKLMGEQSGTKGSHRRAIRPNGNFVKFSLYKDYPPSEVTYY
jgi:hypothetical protein